MCAARPRQRDIIIARRRRPAAPRPTFYAAPALKALVTDANLIEKRYPPAKFARGDYLTGPRSQVETAAVELLNAADVLTARAADLVALAETMDEDKTDLRVFQIRDIMKHLFMFLDASAVDALRRVSSAMTAAVASVRRPGLHTLAVRLGLDDMRSLTKTAGALVAKSRAAFAYPHISLVKINAAPAGVFTAETWPVLMGAVTSLLARAPNAQRLVFMHLTVDPRCRIPLRTRAGVFVDIYPKGGSTGHPLVILDTQTHVLLNTRVVPDSALQTAWFRSVLATPEMHPALCEVNIGAYKSFVDLFLALRMTLVSNTPAINNFVGRCAFPSAPFDGIERVSGAVLGVFRTLVFDATKMNNTPSFQYVDYAYKVFPHYPDAYGRRQTIYIMFDVTSADPIPLGCISHMAAVESVDVYVALKGVCKTNQDLIVDVTNKKDDARIGLARIVPTSLTPVITHAELPIDKASDEIFKLAATVY